MKKIFLYAISGLICLCGLSSCHLLDEETFGQSTADEILQDPANVYRVVGQVYANVKWLQDHWTYFGLNTVTTDEGRLPRRISGRTDWGDGGNWAQFNAMSWTPATEPLEKLWRYCSEGAVLCNNIIEQLNDNSASIADSTLQQATAEVVVMRSYYYYALFDCFGRIPYTDSFGESVTNRELPSVANTWSNLVSDLIENYSKLPTITSTNRATYYGRASKALAFGLLSRLYLNAESFGLTMSDVDVSYLGESGSFYGECIAYCDSIINAGSYTTESSYFNNFLLQNQNSQENIFVIVNDARNNFDFYEVGGAEINKFRLHLLTLHYGFKDLYGLVEEPWNGLCATPEYMSIFEDGDIRGACDGSLKDGGTNIDFTVEANKRGWFVGPVHDSEATSKDPEDGYGVYFAEARRFMGTDDEIRNTSLYKDFQAYYEKYYPETAPSALPLPTVIRVGINDCEEVMGQPYMQAPAEIYMTADANAGARNIKYEIERQASKNNTTHKFGENDFVLMRYAEILYNKAEAAIRGGYTDALNQVINNTDFTNIRTRAGVAAYASGADLQKGGLDGKDAELLKERGREFSWELLRRRDLIRFGCYSGDEYLWQGKQRGTDDHYNWFPIPRLYIQNSGGYWTQNQGY